MSSNTGAGGNGSQMVCDMDEHGTNGDMKGDALNVAATALETYQEEKDISRHIKVVFTINVSYPLPLFVVQLIMSCPRNISFLHIISLSSVFLSSLILKSLSTLYFNVYRIILTTNMALLGIVLLVVTSEHL